jgi:hypothetical protein
VAISGAAAAALVVAAGCGAVVWQHVRPRLPALSTSLPVLDRAIAAVVAAVDDSAAVTVSDLVPSTTCQDTVFAKGSRYTRTTDIYTSPAAEDALIARIAADLPAAWQPTRGTPVGGGPAPLTADPGGGVTLQVVRIDRGWVAATAKTDCRAGKPRPGPAAAPSAPLTAILADLGTTPASWHTESVAYGTGRITTTDTISQTATTGDLPARLARAAPATSPRQAATG